MDATETDIGFDASGRCNLCRTAEAEIRSQVFHGEEGARRRDEIVSRIKEEGRGKPYDSILGVSGGADSSYLALRAKELGLRPLAVHLDNGWNTELAVGNIEKLLAQLGFDLFTYVIDWDDVRDLQRAFFRASVANIEVVTDHAITSVLYEQAHRHGVRYILGGANQASESVRSAAFGHDHRDARHLMAVHRRFGEKKLVNFPIMQPWTFLYRILVNRIRYITLLNYEPYDRQAAVGRLQESLGWVPYGRKHGESRFTRFFQEYVLPTKFGCDKRRAHYSSLICSGQMTRDRALEALSEPMYTKHALEEDLEYVTKKLGFSRPEFEEIMAAPVRTHRDYPSYAWMFERNTPLYEALRNFAKGQSIWRASKRGRIL